LRQKRNGEKILNSAGVVYYEHYIHKFGLKKVAENKLGTDFKLAI
jgi:hypothetical protein